ncbi:MAG TPA: cadherin repeat domain-containing protein [Candidatus Acidoferrum sp.]|jgi:hypothetical protein|nr:cadherin repeat domain-containing protein [Candidatus Acidoferrum sp.]
MSRRAGLYLSYLFLAAACVYGAGCEGCSGSPANFNNITLSSTSTVVLQGGTAVVTAAVTNDPSNGGVSWTLTGVGSLGASTKTTVTYTAPASVASETTVTVNASSVDFPGEKSTIQITIEPGLQITTSSLAAANVGTSYSSTVTAIGGIPGFVWSVSNGTLPAGLSLGSSSTRSVTISGTPTSQGTISFVIEVGDSQGHVALKPLSIVVGASLPLAVATTSLPNGALHAIYPSTTLQASGGVGPFTWTVTSGTFPPGLTLATSGLISGIPTQTGTFSFTVEVADSETPVQTATANLTIIVTDLNILNGNYAFEFNGFTSTGNAISLAGSFTSDGQGNITNGVEDVNAIGAAPKNQTFTGTYTATGNGRGVMTFSSIPGTPTYAFSTTLGGGRGRFIEFDSSGIRGSGDLEQRSLTTCTDNTFNGNYAFGLVGRQIAVTGVSAAGPDVIVGAFPAAGAVSPSTQGSLGIGELDANTPVQVTLEAQATGTYQATSQSTRCSMTLTSSVGAMNFSVYPISPFESFLIETDTVSSSTPILTSGTMQQQTGAPFTASPGTTFTGTSVAALTGHFPSGQTYLPDVALVSVTGTGSSSFSITALENQAGTILTFPTTQQQFELADQFGRVSTNIISPFAPVFYMISPNTAYCIGETTSQTSQPYPFFGIFTPQSEGPFSAVALAGTLEEGTGSPAEPAVPDADGTVTLASTDTSNGTIAGTLDQSTSTANTSGETVAGTFNIISSVGGTGSTALTQPAAATSEFIVVSPSLILSITTTTGDHDPVVYVLQ